MCDYRDCPRDLLAFLINQIERVSLDEARAWRLFQQQTTAEEYSAVVREVKRGIWDRRPGAILLRRALDRYSSNSE